MANPIRWGSEFRINGTLAGAQYDSVIVGAVNGGAMSLFSDLSSGNTNVRARRLDAAGAPAAADFVVNDVLTFNEDSPAIASAANGRMLAVWTDDSQSLADTSASAIHGQLLSPAGSPIGAEFVINTTTAGVQLDPAIAALAGNRFLVSWIDEGSASLRAQMVDFDGALVGAEIAVRSAAGAAEGEPSVAALASGGAFVAWTEQNAGSGSLDASDSGIVGQVLDQNGAAAGGPFLINGMTAGFQSSAKATALAGGRVAVVWTDASASGGDTAGLAIRARVFEADGTPVATEFLVNTTTAGDQSEPAIAALQDGRFIVAWADSSATGGDTSGQAVRARVFTGAGAPDSDEFLVNTATEGRQAEPAIAVLADGRVMISWTDESGALGDTSESGIAGAIFDPRIAGIALAGTIFRDDFAGSVFADSLAGGLLDDKLAGGDGDDILSGGDDADTLDGGAGADRLAGGLGNDTLAGGAGLDTADWSSATGSIVFTLSAAGGGATADVAGLGVDTLSGIENLVGGGAADTLTGNSAANVIDGGQGADILNGGLGSDTYVADDAGDAITELSGQGTDTVKTALASYTLSANVEKLIFTDTGAHTGKGNASNNTLNGNAGADRFLADAGGNDVFSGGNGSDSLNFAGVGAAAINLLTGVHGGSAAGDIYASIEKFFGSNTQGDTMTAGAGRAVFSGQGGNDELTGGSNIDTLIGGAGLDTLNGGGGVDTLQGGKDADTLTGGAGRDYFVYVETAASGGWGADTVTDWQDGLDIIKIDAPGVASSIADFAISGNGTSSVLLTLNALPSSTITLNGAAPITISAADFLFY